MRRHGPPGRICASPAHPKRQLDGRRAAVWRHQRAVQRPQPQPEALWWGRTQFSKLGASEAWAFWRDDPWHFHPSPAELAWWQLGNSKKWQMRKMMLVERFVRMKRTDVSSLSFVSSKVVMRPRIWYLGRLSLVEEGNAYIMPSLKTEVCVTCLENLIL